MLTEKVNITSDISEPHRNTAWLAWICPSVRPWNARSAVRSNENEHTQRMMLPAVPTGVICFNSRLLVVEGTFCRETRSYMTLSIETKEPSTSRFTPLASRGDAKVVRCSTQEFSSLATPEITCETVPGVLLSDDS